MVTSGLGRECLADQLRRRINIVIPGKKMATSKSNSKDQIGSNKHQPELYPVSGSSPLVPSASQKRA